MREREREREKKGQKKGVGQRWRVKKENEG